MFVWTDLHGHSCFSDGRATPEEYVEARRQQGMRLIALTDHDVLAGTHRAAAAAARSGLLLLPGLEVTASLHRGTARAEQFHVLAYYPPRMANPLRLRETELYRRGLVVQGAWRAFVLGWLSERSAEERDVIDPAGALGALPPDEFPALQSVFQLLLGRRRELYAPFVRAHARFWEDEALFGWSPEEAIECIRGDGATDIVAHPARYQDADRTEAVLRMASGFEVFTSRHKPDIARAYHAKAREWKKLWTASSDDHQNARYARPESGTPVSTIEQLVQGDVGVLRLYELAEPQSASPL